MTAKPKKDKPDKNKKSKNCDDETLNTNKSKKAEKETKRILCKNRKKRNDHQYDSTEEKDFFRHMGQMDLLIRIVKGDGNCMFRSIADQLVGNESKHDIYQLVCKYIEEHEEHFKFFIEDDVPFQDYLSKMQEDGEWGGQPELYAAGQCLHVDIYVHQVNAPRFVFLCETAKRSIHISFHGECHYNSVRLISDDTFDQPCCNFVLPSSSSSSVVDSNDDTNNLNNSNNNGKAIAVSKMIKTDNKSSNKLIDIIVLSVPWVTVQDIQTALEMSENDVEDAIEILMSNPQGFSKTESPQTKDDESDVNDNEVTTITRTTRLSEDDIDNLDKITNEYTTKLKISDNDKTKLPKPPPPVVSKQPSSTNKRQIRHAVKNKLKSKGKNIDTDAENDANAEKTGEKCFTSKSSSHNSNNNHSNSNNGNGIEIIV